MRRWMAAPFLFAALTASTLLTDAPEAAAQDKKHPDPVEENFKTADGVRIKGYFHKSANPLPSKGVVILLYEPGVGNSMNKPGDWEGLTKTLLDGDPKMGGFNVFRFDWRGHGKSKDITDPIEFWNNNITGPWNKKYVKGFNKKPIKNDIDVKTDVANLKSYLPVLVNDLAAARLHLDEKNDAGDINSSSIYVIGAGDAAGLGFLWLAAEWARPAIHPLLGGGVAYKLVPTNGITVDPEGGNDIAGAVWLSGTKPSIFPDRTVLYWTKLTPKLRDTNHMLMLYGEKDNASKAAANFFFKQVLVADGNKTIGIKKLDQTYVHELKGTNLKGAALLGNNKELTTEDTLMKFLMGREKDRGAVVTKKRGFTSPYYIDLLRFGAPPP